MKCLLFFNFILMLFISCNAVPDKKQKDTQNPASYSLPQPAGWTKEVFPIPISFAPEINYKGHEAIRFAPGWADSAKNDHWTYGFLWCLDTDPQLNDSMVAANLKYYYDGLVRTNSRQLHISNFFLITNKTVFNKDVGAKEDIQAYQGTIKMND